MNPLVSSMLLIVIVIIAFGIILGIGNPVIEEAKDYSEMLDAERILTYLDNYIKEVSTEGYGASRILKINTNARDFRVIPEEDAVQYKTTMPSELFEYFSRQKTGNLLRISGSDVDCSNTSDTITLENTFLKVVFNKTDTNIDTTTAILNMTEKTLDQTLTFVNTSIVIDDDSSTSSGTGSMELIRSGTNLPMCQVHAYVNSTLDYDVFYTLYAGADFLVIDVRSIR
jgi:hypothetical protein